MAEHSRIEWTDATWNPITGCSMVSAGCRNCYAMRLAGGRLRDHPSRRGLTTDTPNGPVWNGKLRFNKLWLDQPLRWRRPRRVFVCAHSDLFHGKMPYSWIDKVFAVMALAPRHVFQVLTKRPDMAATYLEHGEPRVAKLVDTWLNTDPCPVPLSRQDKYNLYRKAEAWRPYHPWPLPNVWLGTSAENQDTWDSRWPALQYAAAAVRWVSVEPMLGPIAWDWQFLPGLSPKAPAGLNWVVIGGESGPGARPMEVAWAERLAGDCLYSRVPVFVKQLSQANFPHSYKDYDAFPERLRWRQYPGDSLDVPPRWVFDFTRKVGSDYHPGP